MTKQTMASQPTAVAAGEAAWNRRPIPDAPSPAMLDEFSVWMSLALDGRLDEQEQTQFERYQARYPELAQRWTEWQALDQLFAAAPEAEQPSEFVAQFESRLLRRERRRQLWWGALMGIAMVLLWGSVVVGAVSLGAFVMFEQPQWLTQWVHNVAFITATLSNWLASADAAIGTLLAMPQVRGFGFGYLLLATTVLFLWSQLLRRSTRMVEAPSIASV